MGWLLRGGTPQPVKVVLQPLGRPAAFSFLPGGEPFKRKDGLIETVTLGLEFGNHFCKVHLG